MVLRPAILAAVLLGMACGQPPPPGMGGRTPRAQSGSAPRFPWPTATSGRPRLDSLPFGARYRWADPSTVFTGLSPDEIERSMSFASHETRRLFIAVLDANGWREVPDSADFELVVGAVSRTYESVGSVPNPRNDAPHDPCVGQSPRRCVPQPRPQYPPISVRQSVTDLRRLFAVVRLRDSSTRWWIAPHGKEGEVSIALLQMLRNGQDP